MNKDDKKVYTVHLNPKDIPQPDITYRSDTVPNFKIREVKKFIKSEGYYGKIVDIRNTRVDSKSSFRVILQDKDGVSGKFLVNLHRKFIRFDGTVK